ncbi:murein biosynthesis integral membrane protein MurJ [Prochlorococcus marinus]|uniref:murein biosynthesis integral membrane protein MurJ n=1 Tax=Prochlorococcus marinus TaxID=1219 RepID=UPI0022B49944|nr:murein biosynthesis integral membrane protein MurJ [Prochlorococcus marinus]
MKRSLKKISALISFGTFLSKAGGMARQIVIAGFFGVGTAYDAYNYAYILPGFFLILIGGINGPLHNAIVSVLSKAQKKDGAYIVSSINTYILITLLFISLILYLNADLIITIFGPGLTNKTHDIAVMQLQIMSPVILLSGLIGIGFGSLNARDEFFLPSISPLISSLVIITGVSFFWLYQKPNISVINLPIESGIVLAKATLIGAILQLIIQIPFLKKKGLLKFKFNFDTEHSAIKEVWKIIIPATLSSGMLQINVFTDLFFASNILGAAAGLSYANFIVQAPLGIISNSIIIPLLPTFSKLFHNDNNKDLIRRVRQGIIFSASSMIFLGSIFIALNQSVTEICFGRGVFDTTAIKLVSGLLICYGIGMPAYLIRDLLVRVFYTLGDAKTPFKISTIGIILNIFLDWLFIGCPTPWTNQIGINFGANGIILATVGVNIFTCILLLLKLKIRLVEIPLKKWGFEIGKLLTCGIISGYIAWRINSITLIPVNNFLLEVMQLIFSITISFCTYCLLSNILGIKEVQELTKIFKLKAVNCLK